MKTLPKILTIFFLAIFIVQLAGLLFLTLAPDISRAADPATFKPQVGIGDDFQVGQTYTPDGSTSMIAKYVRAIYKYAIGIVGILAAVVLMVGGVMWIVAGGNATAIGEAKAWIGASLTGLVLALCSYLILATVNPALVNFQITGIQKVEKIGDTGRCLGPSLQEKDTKCTENVTENECLKEAGSSWLKDATCPTPCCAWETQPGFTVACGLTPGCIMPVFKYCQVSKDLTKTKCSEKSALTNQYVPNGKCEQKTLGGVIPLEAFKCIPY